MLHLLLAAYLSSQAADTATTAWRLHQPHTVELNPLLPRSALAITGVKIGLATGSTALAWHWRETHPRWAKTILLVGTGSGTFGAVHNLTLRR